MVNRYSYEFKKFASGKRRGQTYCNIRSVKTGKTIRTVSSEAKVKTAIKSAKQQDYREDERLLDQELRIIAKRHGANYEDLKEDYKKAIKTKKRKEKRRVTKLHKEGKKPYGRKVKTLKRDIIRDIDKTAGYVTTWRLYWIVQEGTDTPYIGAQGAASYEGNEFTIAQELVQDVSLPIIDEAKTNPDFNIVPGSSSGACVRLIDRETQQTIRKYELGVGCKR